MSTRPVMAAALALASVLAAVSGLPAHASPAQESPALLATAAYPTVAVDRVLTTGLTSPWGLAFLPDGSALVSERDTGRIVRVPASGGRAVAVGRVRGVVPSGEGGLLGVAVPPGPSPSFVFAYYTTSRDNRVARIAWDGSRLGRQTVILSGIPRASYHDGGRLLVGADSTLYVATGDAGNPALAQSRRSLAGKVLRITFDGGPAAGNPFRGSPVYSLGHRNVQGLAFDSAGRVWASEFGERDVDELNLLRAGGNYGWPVFEGSSDDPRFVAPAVTWPTAEASPAGLAIVGRLAYVAALRGQRLWEVPLDGASAGTPTARFVGGFGRLRAAATAPDGSVWMSTSNTDGRGSPSSDDDRLIRFRPA